jgi:hypothetical protein
MVVNDEQILSTEYFGHKQGKAKTNAKYMSITTKKGQNISKTNVFRFCHHSHFKNKLWALNQRKAPHEIKPSDSEKSKIKVESCKQLAKLSNSSKSTASGYKTDLKEELKIGKCSCLGHNRFVWYNGFHENSLLPWSYAHTSDWTPSSRTKLINKW